jgi:hypothetical protein
MVTYANLGRDFLIDGWCIGTFFFKLSKSLNNLNPFHLHIGKKNKNYDRKWFFGHHDALKIYGAPKLCTFLSEISKIVKS